MTSQKFVPPLKGGRTSDTIKGPSRKEGGKLSDSKKSRSIIRAMTDKTVGGCVQTSFAGLTEVGIILG